MHKIKLAISSAFERTLIYRIVLLGKFQQWWFQRNDVMPSLF